MRHPKSQLRPPQVLAAVVLIELDRAIVAISTPIPLDHHHLTRPMYSTLLQVCTIIKGRISKLGEEKPQRHKLLMCEAGHSLSWYNVLGGAWAVLVVLHVNRLPGLLILSLICSEKPHKQFAACLVSSAGKPFCSESSLVREIWDLHLYPQQFCSGSVCRLLVRALSHASWSPSS